ncbi:MAG: DUF4867 family protein [Bacillota bacterium]
MDTHELSTKGAILSIDHSNFSAYGRVLNYDASEAIAFIESNVILPEAGNAYVAGDAKLESVAVIKQIGREVFAELPIQAGWCVGRLRAMNGMEWHKSSEVIVACSNMVLLLGKYSDIIEDTYDSAKAEAFYVKKGSVIELNPYTLHLAPLNMGDGFAAIIVLPSKTNLALSGGIDGTLRAINKWLLVHNEHKVGIAGGGKIGIVGENITLIAK